MKIWLQTGCNHMCNHMQPVHNGSVVVVWIFRISKSSPVAVTPKMGQKTGPDQTFKHYLADWLTGWLTGLTGLEWSGWSGWLADWPTDWSYWSGMVWVVWLAGWLTDWLVLLVWVVWLTYWLAVWIPWLIWNGLMVWHSDWLTDLLVWLVLFQTLTLIPDPSRQLRSCQTIPDC